MKRRILSLLIIITLVCAQMPLNVALAAEEKYYIRSLEEFQNFVEKCRNEEWSQGKQFVLTTNLDLSGIEFTPIQVFAGSFDGYNHTIYGLEYSGNGYAQGFFRYITKEGIVQNIHISGTVEDENKGECVGGICGVNAGKIANSSFRGIVNGKSEVGGIVGENENTGNISYCNSYGVVTGYDGAGGIVGRNYGTVSGCCNRSGVNCDDSWLLEADEGGLEWILENRDMVTLSSGTDIGGIAGLSRGLLIGNTNYGAVGYEHNGYNIGGIAGRQSGQVLRCNNKGIILGRKDVGGIVGQMEPNIQVNEMDSVSDSMQTLHDQVDILLNDLKSANSNVGTDFDGLREHADAALSYSKDVSNQTTSFVDDNIATLNELLDRLEYVQNELPEVFKHITASMEKIENVGGHLKDANEDFDVIGKLKGDEAAYKAYQDAKTAFEENQKKAQEISGELSKSIEKLRKFDDFDGTVIVELKEIIANISQLSEVTSAMAGNLNSMLRILSPYLESGLEDAHKDLENACKDLEGFATMLQIASTKAQDIAEYLENKDDVNFYELGEGYKNNINQFLDELGHMKEAASKIGNHLESYSDDVLNDLKEINNQFNAITLLMTEKVNNVEDKYRNEEIYEDISDEDIESNTDGKVSQCVNRGYVAGNVNVGGIAGSMAIDEEDPEDSAAGTVDIVFGGKYMTKCVIYKCENQGQIVGKKDGIGGIAGFMKLGIISHCEGYGRVESEEGEYVGGIAGQSFALIRDSYALVSLNANAFVGGITGYGKRIHDCYAMVAINPDAKWKGAIAGFAETEENNRIGYGDRITNNYYVSKNLGGIDQVSFKGATEHMDYNELIAKEMIPEEFQKLHISFVVDNEVVVSKEVSYGEKTAEIELPEIPEVDGKYGKWEEIPFEYIEANIIVNAEYFDQIETLKSDATNKSYAMIDGNFSDEVVLRVEKMDEMVTQSKKEQNAVYYVISLDNAKLSSDVVSKVRVLNPYEKILAVQIQDGDSWKNIDYKEYGSYVQLEMYGDAITVRILEQGVVNIWYIIAAVALALGVLIILLVVAKMRRKSKK